MGPTTGDKKLDEALQSIVYQRVRRENTVDEKLLELEKRIKRLENFTGVDLPDEIN